MNGLREAHAHIGQHGREMSQLKLAGCTSREECLEQVRAEAGRLGGRREWVVASGARVESWASPDWPTMAELDRVCGERPCMVQSFDHHACAVNTAAFHAAGFSASSADPSGGRIVRDGSGEPTGLLLESAYGAVRRSVPEPSPAQWRGFIQAALSDLSRHGFTEVHDLLSPSWLGPMLAEMDSAGELTMPVWLYPVLEDIESVAASRKAWEGPRVRLAGAKVFADGTLNSRTAWMLEPYADGMADLPRGQAMVTPGQLDAALAKTSGLGIGVAVHAIGDAAVRAVLDARQRGRKAPASVNGLPTLRIEHAELVHEADVPRFAELDVVCSVQPCHLLYDIEALTRGVPDRLERVLPLRSLIDSGCRPGELLWFGSDVPIVRPDPQDSIQAAVRRRRADMPGSQAIAPMQAITEDEAWAAYRPIR